jgi:hypothetical protein
MHNNPRLEIIKTLIYTDDGLVAGAAPNVVQEGVDVLSDLFRRCGLNINATKTKALLSQPGELIHAISSPAFSRCLTGLGDTFSARKQRRTCCPRCGKDMQERSLQHHLLSQHNDF